jgi:hypothetical protein
VGTRDPRTRNTALVLLAVGVLVTGGAWATYRYVLPDAGKGLGYAVTDAFKQSNESGAYVASSAASLAQADHISYSNLTVSTLNAKRADETWVSATTNAVTSGDAYKFVVSVEGADDHIVTAVMPLIQCVYGLSVSAPTDPVIQQDQLPGVGTYFNSAGSAYPTTAAPVACNAATAPTAGWTRANPAILQELANGQ